MMATNAVSSLNVASFRKGCTTVGPGTRDAVWLQGCTIGCPGCANQSYLPVERRVSLTVQRLVDHFATRVGSICGCTISGGEPTEQYEAVTDLLVGIKQLGLSTVVYTGKTYESLEQDARFRVLLANVDLLIDGPFISDQQDLTLKWRGSRNQRLLRLSSYFRPDQLDDARPGGEVVVTDDQATMIGVGTLRLSEENFNE